MFTKITLDECLGMPGVNTVVTSDGTQILYLHHLCVCFVPFFVRWSNFNDVTPSNHANILIYSTCDFVRIDFD